MASTHLHPNGKLFLAQLAMHTAVLNYFGTLIMMEMLLFQTFHLLEVGLNPGVNSMSAISQNAA